MLIYFYNIFKFLIFSIFNYTNRYRLICDRIDKKPYLERYYIFLKNRDKFPFNIFIHKFLKSDFEDLHDHPWDFISIPIWPGYWEYTYDNNIILKKWRKPFSLKYSKAEKLHRVELNNKFNYCWTLFIPLKTKREWGFKTSNGWIHNNDYF